MAISFSSGVVNKLLAPGIAQFVACELPDIRPEYPESSHWLSNHFLNSAFRMQFGGSYRQYAINVLFRTQICFALYHEAREATLSYLDGNSSHNPRVGRYFALIARWEACLLNLQMFIDVFNKLNGEAAFQQGDGSAEEKWLGSPEQLFPKDKWIGSRVNALGKAHES